MSKQSVRSMRVVPINTVEAVAELHVLDHVTPAQTAIVLPPAEAQVNRYSSRNCLAAASEPSSPPMANCAYSSCNISNPTEQVPEQFETALNEI